MSQKTENITIRVNPEVKNMLNSMCRRSDRSNGWIISKLIKDEYEKTYSQVKKKK